MHIVSALWRYLILTQAIDNLLFICTQQGTFKFYRDK